MGAALPAHVFMQAPKRPNGTFAGHVGRELVSSQGAYSAADGLSPRSWLRGSRCWQVSDRHRPADCCR